MKRLSNCKPSSSSENLTQRKKARSTNGASKEVSKEEEKIDSLFRVYADDSSGMINPEGIEAFCFNLEVRHTDLRILMLAWKMEAKRQGYFTLEEWTRGLKALHADTITKIKKALPELVKEVAIPSNFASLYSFAYRYCLIEDTQRYIDIESACELLDLILGWRYVPQATKLVEYLKHQNEYKVINRDQWDNILGFCKEINFPSLDNYDPSHSWPIILDNFVAWMREKWNLTDPFGIGNEDGTD